MKALVTILIFVISFSSVAQTKTDVQLKAQSDTIKYEINPKANSAFRVGNMFYAIVANKLNKSLLDTSKTLLGNSDSTVPSQKAVKAYIDAKGSGKGYKEYRVRLLQTSTSRPSYQFSYINEIDNNAVAVTDSNYRSIDYLRTAVGAYTVTFTYNPSKTYYSTDMDIAFSDAKMRLGGVTSGGNGTSSYHIFTFNSYDLSGNLADNIIVNSNIYIRLYR